MNRKPYDKKAQEVKSDEELLPGELLKSRDNIYGDYRITAAARYRIMNILKETNNQQGIEGMSRETEIALGDIVLKLCRAATKPTYKDNYSDIAGYATIIKNNFCKDLTRT